MSKPIVFAGAGKHTVVRFLSDDPPMDWAVPPHLLDRPMPTVIVDTETFDRITEYTEPPLPPRRGVFWKEDHGDHWEFCEWTYDSNEPTFFRIDRRRLAADERALRALRGGS